MQNGFSQDVRSTLRLLPSRALAVDFSASYSPEQKQLSDLSGNLYLTRSRDKFLGGAISLSARYSPQLSHFANINLGADVQLGSKTKLQALMGYNGFSKQFDIQQYRVVRDLHCFNLYGSYDAQRKQIRLDLALKAFPFADSRLGQTLLGEGFDPAIGSVR